MTVTICLPKLRRHEGRLEDTRLRSKKNIIHIQKMENRYGIEWDYGGIIWQQALPIVIVAPGSACKAR